ncbi:MAG: aconitate hydratase AcnA [Candidatus Sumerlaeia bacterium]|nr:aconitate hydratase AcnA [Candidatus Sumerlaeia bacterium]
MAATQDVFGVRRPLRLSTGATVDYYSLPELERAGVGPVSRLPVSIRILLECALRNLDGFAFTEEHVRALANWEPNGARAELPFKPARVVLQDFTGVPAMVDLASMRDAMKRLGGSPAAINPQIPCDLVIDHSVQVDFFGSADALAKNEKVEFERNRERYQFLKWGQRAFKNFRVVPPSTGIVHQVNLEHLSPAVFWNRERGVAYPDSCLGTDSHTPMVNGLGVLAWGVGGIEAEAVMLDQPTYMLVPDVIGFRLTGKMPEGATATDLVLRVTEMCRKRGVVEKFVEFFGPGVASMGVADRATIGNMAPEQGSTISFFPVDGKTLEYLRLTGRPDEGIELVEAYSRAQGMFLDEDSAEPLFTDVMELDLSTIEPALAGPKRPHDRVNLKDLGPGFKSVLTAPVGPRGMGLKEEDLGRTATVQDNGHSSEISHGSVVIAAITSCTNTSNPSVMLGAALLAKKAVERGLSVKPYVKTSLAPGSTVVTEYLDKSGLMPYMEKLGFHTVGYGCTTCIGNSGPLPEPVSKAIAEGDIVAAAVLSGNRNFEGRVNPQTRVNYLASPPLVVAYALAGNMHLDLLNDAIGTGSDGKPVYLRDIWPTNEEVERAVAQAVSRSQFVERYANVWKGSAAWQAIATTEGGLYDWDAASTYIQSPPFFESLTTAAGSIKPIKGARVLGLFADSVTTDHISPAGSIAKDSPAGRYLLERGVAKADWNSYGARRGNHNVMMRGTFANIRIKNGLVPGVEGNVTVHHPTGERLSFWDAAERYQREGTPLVILAGKEYGSGSSRDWAAKGPSLQGIHAAIAESYERIHRSNLVGMGILPLQFAPGESVASLGLDGTEAFDIAIGEDLKPGQRVHVTATKADGSKKTFEAVCRIDTPVEIGYYRNGGILQTVLKNILTGAATA